MYSGERLNGADTVVATIPLGSGFTILEGNINVNGIEGTFILRLCCLEIIFLSDPLV